MTRLQVLLARVLGLFRSKRAEQDLATEIATHLDLLAAEHERQGATPDAARMAARRQFGGIDEVTERYRDQRSFRIFDVLRQDVRYAIRQHRRSPGFAIGAALSLAVGIGFSVAVFTAVDTLLLHPYSFKDVDRMTAPRVYPKSGAKSEFYLTGSQMARLREVNVVDDAVAIDAFPMRGEIDGATQYIAGSRVSLNTFEYWGVTPLLGRVFTGADVADGGIPNRVVVLTYRYWQSHFGGDLGVLGRQVRLDNHVYEVIGVLRRGFLGTYWGTDLYVPTEQLRTPNPHAVYLRLKPGISHEAGAAALQPLFRQFVHEDPQQTRREARLVLDRMDDGLQTRFGDTLRTLLLAGTLLLVVGCANAAILFLARATARRDELTVRRALGAAPGRVVVQLLTEAFSVALLGTLAGLLLAQVGIRLIRYLSPETFFPPEVELHANAAVLTFSVALAVLSTLLFGLWPAIRGVSVANPSLRVTRQGATDSARHNHTYNVLLAAQIALTTVMVASAGAALHSFLTLLRTPLGYQPAHVLRVAVAVPEGQYTQRAERVDYYERLRAAIAQIPAVRSVSVGMSAALVPPNTGQRRRVEIAGRSDTDSEAILSHLVDADYPAALGLSIRQGRWWSASDTVQVAPVAVVNEAMAVRYWPGKDPIGERLRLPTLTTTNTWNLPANNATGWLEVIGVVRNAPNTGLREQPQPAVYSPYTLFVQDVAGMVIRTNGPTDALIPQIRQAAASAAPGTPLVAKSAMTLLEDIGWGQERFISTLFTVVALIVLLLGGGGIFSVVAYVVAQRTREFGIRAALGASRGSLIRRVLSSTSAPLVGGLVIGVAAVVGLNEPVKRLAGITISNAGVIGLAVTILLAVAIAAAVLPARRAARADPLAALRSD